MMEAALDDDDEIFVYMGGDQQVPDGAVSDGQKFMKMSK